MTDGKFPRQPYLHVVKCRGSADSFSDGAVALAQVLRHTLAAMNLMNPQGDQELKTLESALAPIAPTKSASRVWRIVGLVVAFQFIAIIAVVVLFSGLGLANDGVGSCGGG